MPNDSNSDSKRLYKVFVSSTYLDNQERRKIVEDAITMAGMVWHGMELFTASTRPTVEECIRLAGEADLLVGIVAWRYGWIPPGREFSITELEYAAAKERLMFKLDPSVRMNPEEDFDEGPDKWKKQEKLDAFKARFSSDQMPALFDEKTIGQKVLHALNEWRANQEGRPEAHPVPKPSATAPEFDADLEEEIRSYREKMEILHKKLPLTGFKTHIRVPIHVEDIYVPLRAMIDLRGVGKAHFADACDAEQCVRESGAGSEISIPEAFHETEKLHRRGMVILGDPGSGKTTHLKRLALWCLHGGTDRLGLPEGMLPVFLPLRDLEDLSRGLDAFIEEQLDQPHFGAPEGFGKRLMNRGNLLFLFDGLDEVADLVRRGEAADWIESALGANTTCRFVVTCRFAGYSPEVRIGEDFIEMHMRPLTTDQAEAFIHNWYRIV